MATPKVVGVVGQNTLDTSTSPEPMARPAARARNRSIHQLSAFDSNNTHNGVATLEEAAHRLQRKSGEGSAHARRDKPRAAPGRSVCDVVDPCIMF